MLKKGERILLGISIAVGVADLALAHGTYLKKKGVVLRDMILKSIEDQAHKKEETGSEAGTIPIE